MNNRVLLCSLTAAVLGWGCCFGVLVLSAQERDFQTKDLPDRPPRPKAGQAPEAPESPRPPQAPTAPRPPQAPRPDRPGERKGPPDGERSMEGGYSGRPGTGSMLMRMAGRIMIAAPDATPQTRQEVEEDMTTMLHLIERTVEKELDESIEEGENYRNIPAVLSSESRAVFLDDYGMIFTLRTPQILNGPATGERPSSDAGPRGTQWERARQELFGGRGADGTRDYRPGLQYDAVKVAALKEALQTLLRDAVNLRHLKPEQTVAIILAGSPSLSGRPPKPQSEEGSREASPLERFRAQMTRATCLMLRAKKADIDAYAQGSLTAEQFKGRINVVNN